jgi:hypothetical protein
MKNVSRLNDERTPDKTLTLDQYLVISYQLFTTNKQGYIKMYHLLQGYRL